LLLTLPPPVKLVAARLNTPAKLALARSPHRDVTDLLDDCAGCAVDRLMAQAGGPAWDEAGFWALRDRVRADVVEVLEEIITQVRAILSLWYTIRTRLEATTNPTLQPSVADMKAQLAGLVYRGFVTATGWRQLPHLPRYLEAIQQRLDKLPGNPHRDRQRMQAVEEVQQAYRELVATVPATGATLDALWRVRWMIEELRVSYFAQGLGTAYPVSDKRIYRAIDELMP